MSIRRRLALPSAGPVLASRATEPDRLAESSAPIHPRENTMTKSLLLATLLALGVATAASAGVFPVQRHDAGGLVITVAEGCGAGWWRGPGGHCHPMFNGRACPPGYHLGPERRRCWPN
jgi:hypothetical protein